MIDFYIYFLNTFQQFTNNIYMFIKNIIMENM